MRGCTLHIVECHEWRCGPLQERGAALQAQSALQSPPTRAVSEVNGMGGDQAGSNKADLIIESKAAIMGIGLSRKRRAEILDAELSD